MHSFGSLSFSVKKMIFCRCIIFLIKRISSPVSLFHYAGRFPVIWYHSARSRDNVPLCEKGWIDEFWVVLEICILWRSFDLIAALNIKALDAFTSLREDSVVWHLWSENWRVSCSLVMRWAAVYSGLCLDSEKYLIFWCTLQNVDFCPPKTQLLTDNKISLRYETIFETSSANALSPPPQPSPLSNWSLRLTTVWSLNFKHDSNRVTVCEWNLRVCSSIFPMFFSFFKKKMCWYEGVRNLTSSLYFQLKTSSPRRCRPKRSSEMEVWGTHPTLRPRWWGEAHCNSYLYLLPSISFVSPPTLLPELKNGEGGGGRGRVVGEWRRLLDAFWKAEVFILSACQQLMIELEKNLSWKTVWKAVWKIHRL